MSLLLAQVGEPAAAIPAVEWSWIWPLIILAVGGIALITVTSIVPAAQGRGIPAAITAVLAGAAVAVIPWLWGRLGDHDGSVSVLADSFVVDYFSLFVTGVLCVGLFFTSLLLDSYLRREGLDGPEWYVLLLLSTTGGILLASAQDLILAFVGLEILSIAAYVLASLHLRRATSQEAGFKYFVLGALSSAVFLYGIALVYGASGRTRLTDIAATLVQNNSAGLSPSVNSSLILAGVAMMMVGFGFKVSAAPFHQWAPDVYQGAPSPIVAFMASAVKVAAFAGFLRVFIVAFHSMSADWRPLLAAMAVFTILVGAFLAVVQSDVKRMFAYSSVTHAGFMLIALFAAGSDNPSVAFHGGEAILFYFLAYTVMVCGSFAVVTVVAGQGDGDTSLSAYRGLARREPLLATLFAILLLGQAGIPFTAGFFAKFRVIAAAVEDGEYLLAGAAMLGSVVAAYLYLRIIVNMFMLAPAADSADASEAEAEAGTAAIAAQPRLFIPRAVMFAVLLAGMITVALGVFPGGLGYYLTDAASTVLSYGR